MILSNIDIFNLCVNNNITQIVVSPISETKVYGVLVVTSNFQEEPFIYVATSITHYKQLKAFCKNQIQNDNTIINCTGYIKAENCKDSMIIDYIYPDN